MAEIVQFAPLALFAFGALATTMVMMLDGRFSGKRRFFPVAFVTHVFLLASMVFIYSMRDHAGFDESYGIILMPGFAVYATCALLGVVLGGLVIVYEDLRPLWTGEEPDEDPRGRDDIPTNDERRSSTVVELRRNGTR